MAEAKKMSQSDLVAEWERIQIKTFTNWVNSHLVKRGLKINNVTSDLRDGVMLVNLLEIISEESIPKWNKKPRMRIHNIENLGYCLKFIAEHDVKLASIGAEAIVDGDAKLTLGMIWTIILRFAIAGLSEEGLSAKQGLLLWCQRKTEPYDNVDVQDFTNSFQDGLAFCALIHRHRPDLIDYEKLTAEDKLGNLNLAFDVALEHLGVARLLDAEDIVNVPRPDERSIMTYVAQLYNVFSSLDKIETAGRRLGKFADFARTIEQLRHDYEERTRALNAAVTDKTAELATAPLGDDYVSAKDNISGFKEYKKTQRREWVVEQADLVHLLASIQAKLRATGRPPYVPPEGLKPSDVDANMDGLRTAERERRRALNANLRAILDKLRKDFASLANEFFDTLQEYRAFLGQHHDTDLEDLVQAVETKLDELKGLESRLRPIEEAEQACDAANIEENEFTDHTYDDLSFEFEQLVKGYDKQIDILNNQIAEKSKSSITEQQMKEFKESFHHFSEGSSTLSRLGFKSCLSGLGVVKLDFEGGDKVFEGIFKRVSQGNETISFEQFVDYMVSITEDRASADQLRDSLDIIAGGKDFITESDLRTAQLSSAQVEYLTSVLPRYEAVEGGFDYKTWLAEQFA
ncbi:Alpha-actinin, sarcomeric [Balamuthia mandrillaris]